MNQRLTCLIVLILCVFGAASLQAQLYKPYYSNSAYKGGDVRPVLVHDEVVLPKGPKPFQIQIPTPTGGETTIELSETSVFNEEMRRRYSQISTYHGVEKGTGNLVAVSQDPRGLNIVVLAPEGSWQIEPTATGQARVILSSVMEGDQAAAPSLGCGYTDEMHEQLERQTPATTNKSDNRELGKGLGQVSKRLYILALACTGEYGFRYGPTKAQVNASYAQALNLLNLITMRDVAVEFQLHPQNDTLIFLSASTDPYSSPTLGRGLLSENPPAINSRIPVSSYDIGHVFTNGCSDVGGVVSGRACSDEGKARGVTCHYTSSIRQIVERVLAHEIAHQFAVSHSWNNCPGSDGQRAGIAAFEPGSGSTIMSYQGSCGPDNNVSNLGGDAYYHVGSVNQFLSFTRNGFGATCADVISVSNQEPIVSAPGIDGLTIPKSTPFVLKGSATDPDNNTLYYNWEQYDLGFAAPLCMPKEDSPLFRSLPPSTTGNVRYFPKLSTVRNNGRDCEELLPDNARDLTFRLTARDLSPLGGGTVWQEVKMRVDANAGPFAVTSQATAASTYSSGEFVTITWDVANTNVAPVGVTEVDILLSMDDGRTYPFTLVSGTGNDGSEGVTLPNVEGTNARIMVRSVGNVFYSLSRSRFTILTPTAPGFTFVPSETTTFLCLPEAASIDLFTSSLLGFNETLSLSISSTVPTGINASLNKLTLMPGEQARLTVDFSNFEQTDSVYIDVTATADGVPAATRRLLFDVVSNNFSDLELLSPQNGEEGLSARPKFVFTPSQRAREHVIQVNTDPGFGPGTFEIENPTVDSVQFNFLLESNTVYFWRVLPKNRCGESFDVPVNAFHTFAADCREFVNNTPILIPANLRTTVEAVIPILESGPVNDLNVPKVDVRFNSISNIRVILQSPDGTAARLYSRRCQGNQLVSGYDDDAALENNCTPPPTDGATRKPAQPLSVFNGKEIRGDWKLQVEVLEPGSSGGEFNSFRIEFCANITSQSPTLELNTVQVPAGIGKFQLMTDAFLRAEDADNSLDQLEYIIVTEPTRGHLELYGVRLEVGDRFNQAQSSTGGLRYVDDEGSKGTDQMTIVLTDNSGNLIATPTINFDIDPDFVLSVEEKLAVGLSLVPNPTGGRSTLRFAAGSEGGKMTLLDVQGRILSTQRVLAGQREVEVDASTLPNGIYLVDYRGAEGVRTLRLVRQ